MGCDDEKEGVGCEVNAEDMSEGGGNAGRKLVAPFGSVPGKPAKAQEVSCMVRKAMGVM